MNINLTDPDVIREMKENPQRNVAVVGLLSESGEIFLIRTIRFPNHWQPLGGGIDPKDATVVNTLIREIKEEAGLDIRPKDFKHELTVEYDFGKGEVHFFTTLIDSNTKIKIDESQIIDWKWFLIEDAVKLNMFPATQKFINCLLNKRVSQK